jgi:glucose/arabinose dehydrogenase
MDRFGRLVVASLAALVAFGAVGCDDSPAPTDGGPIDSGPRPDSGSADAGSSDGGRPDAGRPDAGDLCASLTLPGLDVEEVAPGTSFTSPIFLTQPAGVDALFVVEQPGRIRSIAPDGTVGTFLDIRGRVGAGGERGLLGLAFHPDYTSNGRFFVYYTPNDAMQNVVAEYAATSDRLVASDVEIQRVDEVTDPEGNHNGGMIAFGPDGFLYVGHGDGGGGGDRHGPTGNGLNLDVVLGKILRLDVDNAPSFAASGNPFEGGGGLPQIWAYGVRNPWRFSFDRLTGDLYIGDVGQNMWEEIDFQPADVPGGRNYGWRAYEGLEVFDAPNLGLATNHTPPVTVYPHSGTTDSLNGCSVTGGYVYRGSAIPDLRGWYLFGDYCAGERAAFKMCGGAMMGLQLVGDLDGVINNLTSWGEDQNGELYMLGSSVVRIIPR